jgi:hypothetical protein
MVKGDVEVVIKCYIDSSLADWLEKKKVFREKGNVTKQALEFYYDYNFNRKGFLIRLIDLHFQETKHLLRKIGRFRNT